MPNDRLLDTTFVTHVRRARETPEAALVQLVDGPDAPGDHVIPVTGLTIGTGAECTPRLSDKRVSRNHLHVVAENDGFRVRDLGSSNGTFVDGLRIDDAHVPSGTIVEIGRTRLRLLPGAAPALEAPSKLSTYAGMVGQTEEMRRVFAMLERVKSSNASVLILGETGTGKELIAQAVHSQGPRKSAPLVEVDCGAISPTLIESELFGHVRGAFTGAHEAHAGAFERANGGVLFLDEIGELPIDLQPKLLRALESREVRRVGGSSTTKFDVRIVAATHRDLAEMVDDGSFRADLYYRFAVVEILLPPLRDRLGDIPLLVERILSEAGATSLGPIRGPNLERLLAHGWPGNVRELRNVLQRALACAGSNTARFSELSMFLGERGVARSARPEVDTSLPFFEAKERLASEFENAYLRAMLADCEGNVAEASRRSGIARRHLYDLLKKHGLRG